MTMAIMQLRVSPSRQRFFDIRRKPERKNHRGAAAAPEIYPIRHADGVYIPAGAKHAAPPVPAHAGRRGRGGWRRYWTPFEPLPNSISATAAQSGILPALKEARGTAGYGTGREGNTRWAIWNMTASNNDVLRIFKGYGIQWARRNPSCLPPGIDKLGRKVHTSRV